MLSVRLIYNDDIASYSPTMFTEAGTGQKKSVTAPAVKLINLLLP